MTETTGGDARVPISDMDAERPLTFKVFWRMAAAIVVAGGLAYWRVDGKAADLATTQEGMKHDVEDLKERAKGLADDVKGMRDDVTKMQLSLATRLGCVDCGAHHVDCVDCNDVHPRMSVTR